MHLIRPVQLADLDSIYQLASKAPKGLTTLPYDKEKLERRITESVKNTEYPPSRPGGESFLFVLEDTVQHKIIGTSAVYTKVGGFEPFWTYEIKEMLNECKTLGLSKGIQYLEVKTEHNGPSEIGTLFLDPDERKGHAGRMLSLSRFLFIAQYKNIFENEILAELRGTLDDNGKSPFWEAIGAHFFGISYDKAEFMASDDKTFITDLMPKHPVYVPMLPKEAQLVMGVVADEARPAMRLLEQEGFLKIPEIDIFEAGPVLSCKTDQIRAVRESKTNKLIEKPKVPSQNKQTRLYLIANTKSPQAFLACVSEIIETKDGVYIPDECTKAIHCKVNDIVRYTPLRAESKR